VYYFGYCTFLNEPELRQYLPEAKAVVKGYAANHRLEFRGTVSRTDRGWCHLNDGPEAFGHKTYGVVFEHPEANFQVDYPDFERCFLTVYGEDGKTYDCWTYRMTSPGENVRPPDFYWAHVPAGLAAWDFPEDYVEGVLKDYEAAKPVS
jgi:hypothetical protein